jgi:hypothetical protein
MACGVEAAVLLVAETDVVRRPADVLAPNSETRRPFAAIVKPNDRP